MPLPKNHHNAKKNGRNQKSAMNIFFLLRNEYCQTVKRNACVHSHCFSLRTIWFYWLCQCLMGKANLYHPYFQSPRSMLHFWRSWRNRIAPHLAKCQTYSEETDSTAYVYLVLIYQHMPASR